MQHFYDGQIRRYITQMVRLLSNFSYKDSDGNLVQVPVMYGDITRQVGHILRDNSENKIPSAPRIGVYVTGLDLDRSRTADPTFVSKVHLRERTYDDANKEYLNTQGKNYTVERLMPTPYTLQLNADIWSTNTDQKLQIMEQILMLFNPSLEIQTTDNYIDWASLTTVELSNVNFSSRAIPIGTESDIDVAQLGFTTPIYISPPVKVKKLGVITSVVMSIWDESTGSVDLKSTFPELTAYQDDEGNMPKRSADGKSTVRLQKSTTSMITYKDYDLSVLNNIAQIISKGVTGAKRWEDIFEAMPGDYQAGLTQIQLQRELLAGETVSSGSVNGTVTINPLDETQLTVNWDEDTFPTNTTLTTPSGRGNPGSVDFIVNPGTFNPATAKIAGLRLLLLGAINTSSSVGVAGYDGPDAWKNSDDTDFVAGEHDVVEWDGTQWHVVFDASANTTPSTITYITNLNTGVQYKWNGTEWLLSFEGEYRKGTWRIVF